MFRNFMVLKLRKPVFILCVFSIVVPLEQGIVTSEIIYPAANDSMPFSLFKEILVVADNQEQSTAIVYAQITLDSIATEMDRVVWIDYFEWSWETKIVHPNHSGLLFSLPCTDSGRAPFLSISDGSVRIEVRAVFLSEDRKRLSEYAHHFYLRKPDIPSFVDEAWDPPLNAGPYAAPPSHDSTVHTENTADLPAIWPDAECGDDDTAADTPVDWAAYDVQQHGEHIPDEVWAEDQARWLDWMPRGAAAAGRCLFNTHHPRGPAHPRPPAPPPAHAFLFPAVVLSFPHREDRRRHTAALLRGLGFAHVSFPRVTPADAVDVPALLRAGAVTADGIRRIAARHGARAVRPYVANAVGRARTLAAAAAAAAPLVAVFEDDLAAGAGPAATNRRIAAALRALPPDADALYLEACAESCAELRYSARRPGLARAAAPYCGAAAVWTARGARRAAALLTPAFAGIDDMLAQLVAEGRLQVYLALPGLLFQDGYWGSDAARDQNMDRQATTRGREHVLFAPLCEDGAVYIVSARAARTHPAEVARLATGDPRLRRELERSVARYGPCDDTGAGAGDGTGGGGGGPGVACDYVVLADSGVLCPACVVPEGGGAALVTVGHSATGEVEVAYFEGGAGALEGPAVLRLDVHSECWGGWSELRDECAVVLVVEGCEGEEIGRHQSVILLEKS